MSLSICLITRDAEPTLSRALRSVAPLGAEVVVVDTGSRDGTVEAARAAGAAVHVEPWRDDFAAARNAALERAAGDWVLWLNPDEEFVPTAEPVAPLLSRADALGYLVRVRELTDPARPDVAIETWQPRLFRRAGARFVGRLHPSFSPPLDELARSRGQELFKADVLLRHHAYLSVLTEDKLRWATRLLELELRDRPGQLHYLIEYGRNLLRLNDPRGHDVLAETSEAVLAAKDAPAPPVSAVASLLEYALTVSPGQSRTRLTPLEASVLAQRWFPNSPPLLWALAERAFAAEAYDEAGRLLEWLVYLGRSGTYDRSAGFDPSVMGEPAVLNLGLCYLRLGDPGRAEACFTQLIGSPAYQERARQGLAKAEALRRRVGPR